MPVDARKEMMEILRAHPDFGTTFKPPESVTQPEAMERWQIGVAGCWPDIVSGTDQERPTWHYELGASMVVGNITPDERPGPLPESATMDTQELFVSQAAVLALRTYRDETKPKSERAIALCWVLHLFADGHQPCHAGSCYAPVFEGHDRGANSIKLAGGGNLHAAWDRLLGGDAKANDVRRRVAEIGLIPSDDPGLPKEFPDNWLAPKRWIAESRELAQTHVYTDEVLQPIRAASRDLTEGLPELKLSEEYFGNAARIATRRAWQAGLRLALVLGEH